MADAATSEIFSFLAKAADETAMEAELSAAAAEEVGANTDVVMIAEVAAVATSEAAGVTVWPSESTTTVS